MSVYVGFKIGKAKARKAYVSEYYCGGCGYPVSDHDSYCPECGGAFRKEDATERTCRTKQWREHSSFLSCSACGGDIFAPWFSYCPSCGAKIVD